MSIIVRPAIEVENPFGAIASYISENVLPLVIAIETNKKQIQKLSDTELSDHTDILKQYAPDLLTPEGKIDWSKVEEYASSDDRTKQKLASYLLSARQLRTDFANASLYEKLQMLDAVGKATSPDQLRKIAVVGQGLKKVLDVIEKSNAPDELKLWFLLNHEAFYEKPELLEAVMKIFSKKEQASTKEEAKAPDTSWSLSYSPETLEEQVRKFLPDVELSLNLPAPPKIPTTKTKNSAPKSNKKEKPQKTATDTKEQKPVLPPPKEVGLQDAGFLDPIDLLLGGGALAGIGALGYGAFKYGPRIFSLIKEAPSKVVRLLKDLLLRKPSNKASQTADTVKTSTTPQSNKALLREERRQELRQRIAKEIKGTGTKALPPPQKATPEDIKRVQEGLKKLEELKKIKRWEEVVRRVEERQKKMVEEARRKQEEKLNQLVDRLKKYVEQKKKELEEMKKKKKGK